MYFGVKGETNMRKMQVLGIELQDHTVREAMKKTDAFLRDGKVSTIAYITMRGLMEAEGSQERQDFLRELDLTVPADSDILRAAGIATRNRVREVDNDEFLTEFLRLPASSPGPSAVAWPVGLAG